MIYFWTDTHFHHANIIRYSDRPFWYDDATKEKPDVEAMNAALIANWNSAVQPEDTIYFLGDFSFSKKKAEIQKIFEQLNGHKFLIKGNHDHSNTRSLAWAGVFDYKEIVHEEKLFVLFHYPIASWKNKSHGSIHLYGHVHGNPQNITGKCLEPSFDNGYTSPVSIDFVMAQLASVPAF